MSSFLFPRLLEDRERFRVSCDCFSGRNSHRAFFNTLFPLEVFGWAPFYNRVGTSLLMIHRTHRQFSGHSYDDDHSQNTLDFRI